MTPDEFRKMRKAARMTQAQMAERLGKSRKTIVNWETGVFAIPADAIDPLVEVGVAASPELAKNKLDDAYFEIYVHCRRTNGWTHAQTLEVWRNGPFSPWLQQQIIEAFPDILTNPGE